MTPWEGHSRPRVASPVGAGGDGPGPAGQWVERRGRRARQLRGGSTDAAEGPWGDLALSLAAPCRGDRRALLSWAGCLPAATGLVCTHRP